MIGNIFSHRYLLSWTNGLDTLSQKIRYICTGTCTVSTLVRSSDVHQDNTLVGISITTCRVSYDMHVTLSTLYIEHFACVGEVQRGQGVVGMKVSLLAIQHNI